MHLKVYIDFFEGKIAINYKDITIFLMFQIKFVDGKILVLNSLFFIKS